MMELEEEAGAELLEMSFSLKFGPVAEQDFLVSDGLPPARAVEKQQTTK